MKKNSPLFIANRHLYLLHWFLMRFLFCYVVCCYIMRDEGNDHNARCKGGLFEIILSYKWELSLSFVVEGLSFFFSSGFSLIAFAFLSLSLYICWCCVGLYDTSYFVTRKEKFKTRENIKCVIINNNKNHVINS